MRSDSLIVLAQNNFPQNRGGGPSAVVLLIELVLAVVTIVGLWKIYSKAGKPGWAAVIPIDRMAR